MLGSLEWVRRGLEGMGRILGVFRGLREGSGFLERDLKGLGRGLEGLRGVLGVSRGPEKIGGGLRGLRGLGSGLGACEGAWGGGG